MTPLTVSNVARCGGKFGLKRQTVPGHMGILAHQCLFVVEDEDRNYSHPRTQLGTDDYLDRRIERM